MKNSNIRFLFAVIFSTTFIALFIAGYQLSPDESYLNRIFLALGGNFKGGGYIQYLTYLFFFFGIFEIIGFTSKIKGERDLLKLNILPEEKHKVITADDVSDLKHKALHFEEQKDSKFYLTSLVAQAATKFRANESVPEVLETVIRQSQLNSQASESSQSILRYVAWVIPSIGFIGTVLGISGGIGAATGDMTTDDIDKVTSLLGVAFDTTLIALILSIIIMFLIHKLQEKDELLHNDIEQYVMNNFINRIYTSN